MRNSSNATVENNTSIGAVYWGFGIDDLPASVADAGGGVGCPDAVVKGSSASLTGKNNLMISSANGYGFMMQITNWSLQKSNAFSNMHEITVAGTSAQFAGASTTNPGLGACKVWIPDNSPMKRAGSGGMDIGANVLYRYQNGVLTNQPLWDAVTGEFPHGAIVAGVNDIAGSSLFDVHKRLNVNTNGCSFPAGYASGGVVTVTKPSSPINLNVSLQ